MDKILIKNGILHTMSEKDEAKFVGDILIEDGKIKEIGKGINCSDAQIIDANGLHVLPGLIDAHSHIGVFDMSTYPHSADDANEMVDANTANMDIRYSINVNLPEFKASYECGVTTLVITPGSANVINGSAVATKTYGTNIFDMQIKYPVALKLAFGGNPKRTHGEKGRPPVTRMGVSQILIEAIREAKEYMEAKENGLNPPYDTKKEAFIPVLKGEIPFKIHCTQFDMISAMHICNEFNCKFSLEHAWGASDYIDEIVNSKAMICYGPIGTYRGFGERRKVDVEAVKTLDDKGVLISIVTDSPLFSEESIYHYVGEAVREGLDVERALRMVTINPAKISGIDDRVGSLEVGKDADIVVFKGLFAQDADARPLYTIIDGKIVYKYEASF